MTPLVQGLRLAGWRLSLHAGRLLRDQRGQALAEYSTITFALLIGAAGLGFAMPVVHGQSLVAALYKALQTYVDSVNFALSLAAT